MLRRKLDGKSCSLTLKDSKKLCRDRFAKCKSLYRKDLLGHFGCVNAVEFSNDGRWLVSGGDDRRVLLWDVNKVVRKGDIAPSQMKTEHLSNIFCTVFDNDTKHIFSAGNDEDVVRHNIDRAEAVGHYTHEEAVYCVALPHDGSNFFATAGECGAVFLWDVRAPNKEQLCLAMSSGSFHGAAFNPYETQLIVTANAYDGVILYDLRRPEVPLVKYGVIGQHESAMFAKFNRLGTQILALMRRSGPVLFDVENDSDPIQFNHPEFKNICTLKSPSFIGEADEYVASGSDDFNIYLWNNPGNNLSGGTNEDPFMVLKGHRSIVNQIRYNPLSRTIASSGVEKVIKLWSQFRMEGCHGYITEEEDIAKREFYSHEQYMQLVVDSGVPLSHDYGMRSVDEDPRMLAFFDSLIQRVNAGWFSDDSSDDDSPIEEVLLHLASQVDEDIDDTSQNNSNVLDFRRILRLNRRLLTEDSDRPEDQDARSAFHRRLRRIFAEEILNEREASDSEARLESSSDGPLRRIIAPEIEGSNNNQGDQNQSDNEEISMSGEDNVFTSTNSVALGNTEGENFLATSSVSNREVGNDGGKCGASSSGRKDMKKDQTMKMASDVVLDKNDGDCSRSNSCRFVSEMTHLETSSEQETLDCCLCAKQLESQQGCCFRETFPTISNRDKQPMQAPMSAHLCEKTKPVCNCSNDIAKRQTSDRTNSNNYTLDNDEMLTCNAGYDNCSYCSCCTGESRSVEDPSHSKRKRLEDACFFEAQIDHPSSLDLTNTMPASTNLDATSTNINVNLDQIHVSAGSSHCSTTHTTTSFMDNETSDSHDNEARFRSRSGYKKRRYRSSSDS